jgi:hypothetical protein
MHGGCAVILRLLDFFTGDDHPLAATPVLTIFTSVFDYTDLNPQAEVLGDMVLVHVHQGYWINTVDPLCQWYLVEWKTGHVVNVSIQDLQQLSQYLTRPNL